MTGISSSDLTPTHEEGGLSAAQGNRTMILSGGGDQQVLINSPPITLYDGQMGSADPRNALSGNYFTRNEPFGLNTDPFNSRHGNHQPWSESVESFIKSFLDESEEGCTDHNKAAAYCLRCRNFWGFPPILIPLIMAPISTSPLNSSPNIEYIVMSSFIVCAMFSAVAQFFNYGRRSERHFTTAAKFEDLITDIKETLAKHRQNRGEAAVVMRTIRMRYDQIAESAPNII